jgi:hypothetical protein
MKKLLVLAVLLVCSLSIASARVYEITFAAPTKVGAIELKPGQYTLKLSGMIAIFTHVETSKSFTTPVKVQEGEKKFDDTRVDASKQGGTDVVKDIQLGGTKTTLEFSM